MAQAVFDQVNLVVRDMQRSLAFYRRLGVEIPDSALWSTPSGVHHMTIKTSGTFDFAFDSHALAREYNQGFAAERGRVLIGFRLPTREAVDATYADLIRHEHQGLQPPYDVFWGARFAIVEDPDGNPVGLMSPADRSRGGPPPKI
ncbi:MAG TPA: VOC family protein [Caulobacteraceae bacterium]|nr:VOC family protein [Caulobacteraceae bacterium]